MSWFSGLSDWASGLFGGGGNAAPEVNYPADPGGLSELVGQIDAPVWAPPTATSAPGGGSWWDSLFGDKQAPAVPAEGAAPAGTGNWFDTIMGGISKTGGVLKAADPLLRLGATGLGAVSSIQNMRRGAQENKTASELRGDVRRFATPMAEQGSALATAGSSALLGGPLPAGLQAQVDQYRQALLAKLRDQYARAGIDVTTMMPQAEAYANQQAMAFAAQLAANLYASGNQGVQAGTGSLGNLAAAATGQSNQAQSAAANASQNIFRILAS
jgi:hypothetical protein